MNIAFYGGQTAGMIILLTLKTLSHDIRFVIPDDEKVHKIGRILDLPITDKKLLNTPAFIETLSKTVDIFICCHGWKILNEEFVTKIKCINFHPCLYKYKGLHPVQRLITDKNTKASVGIHLMTPRIDEGKTIVELFKEIPEIEQKTEADVYNELYPLYVETFLTALTKL